MKEFAGIGDTAFAPENRPHFPSRWMFLCCLGSLAGSALLPRDHVLFGWVLLLAATGVLTGIPRWRWSYPFAFLCSVSQCMYFLLWQAGGLTRPEFGDRASVLWLPVLFAALTLCTMVVLCWMLATSFLRLSLLGRRAILLPADTSLWPEVEIWVRVTEEPDAVVRAAVLAAVNQDWPQEKLRVILLVNKARKGLKLFAEQSRVVLLLEEELPQCAQIPLLGTHEASKPTFIAVFKALEAPVRSCLQLSVGTLAARPSLGFVQLPIEPAQPCVEPTAEGEASDLWNAVPFMGSCAVLRSAALRKAGVGVTEVFADPLHTSAQLLAAGWESAFLNLPLAAAVVYESTPGSPSRRLRADPLLTIKKLWPMEKLRFPSLVLRRTVQLCATFLCVLPAIALAAPSMLWMPVEDAMPSLVPCIGLIFLIASSEVADALSVPAARTVLLAHLAGWTALAASHRFTTAIHEEPFVLLLSAGVSLLASYLLWSRRTPLQRRSFLRLREGRSVRWLRSGKPDVEAKLLDISRGGAQIQMEETGIPLADTRGTLLIAELPGEHLAARVVRAEGQRVHLQFSFLSAEQEKALVRFLYSRADRWLQQQAAASGLSRFRPDGKIRLRAMGISVGALVCAMLVTSLAYPPVTARRPKALTRVHWVVSAPNLHVQPADASRPRSEVAYRLFFDSDAHVLLLSADLHLHLRMPTASEAPDTLVLTVNGTDSRSISFTSQGFASDKVLNIALPSSELVPRNELLIAFSRRDGSRPLTQTRARLSVQVGSKTELSLKGVLLKAQPPAEILRQKRRFDLQEAKMDVATRLKRWATPGNLLSMSGSLCLLGLAASLLHLLLKKKAARRLSPDESSLAVAQLRQPLLVPISQ